MLASLATESPLRPYPSQQSVLGVAPLATEPPDARILSVLEPVLQANIACGGVVDEYCLVPRCWRIFFSAALLAKIA